MRLKQFLIPIEIYNCDVHLLVVDNIMEELILLGLEPDTVSFSPEAVRAFTTNSAKGYHKGGDLLFIVNPEIINIPTVFHEVSHLVTMIMDHVGVIRCGESDEAFSYLGDHIFEKVYKILRDDVLKDNTKWFYSE